MWFLFSWKGSGPTAPTSAANAVNGTTTGMVEVLKTWKKMTDYELLASTTTSTATGERSSM